MKSEFDISDILQKLRNRELTGKTLPKHVVLELVELLKSEGWRTIAISSLLGYDPRQIRRFLQEIRKRNGVKFNTGFCSERIGSFLQKTELASEFLIRTYHDSNQPIQSRIAGSVAVLKYANHTMVTLSKLGLCGNATLEKTKPQQAAPKQDADPPLSAQDQKIMEEYKKLSPMDRERLLERLHREIKGSSSEHNLL